MVKASLVSVFHPNSKEPPPDSSRSKSIKMIKNCETNRGLLPVVFCGLQIRMRPWVFCDTLLGTADSLTNITVITSDRKKYPRAFVIMILFGFGSAYAVFPAASQKDGRSQTGTTPAELVRKVLTPGENAKSALIAALLEAGCGVRGTNGKVVQKVKPGQGMIFNEYDLDALARMLRNRIAIQLTNLSFALTNAFPELGDVPVQDLLINGIRDQARSKLPEVRFWGLFIVELGRQAEPSYDLLEETNVANIHFDAIQHAMIIRRLARDLLISEARNKGKRASISTSESVSAEIDPPLPYPSLTRSPNAGIHVTDDEGVGEFDIQQIVNRSSPLLFAANNGSTAMPDCTLKEDGPITGGEVAAGYRLGFDALMDYLKKQGMGGAHTLGGWTARATGLLAYLKLAMTMAFMEVSITMDNPPLVRRKDTVPGGSRELTAKVSIEATNSQFLNCFRIALNNVGIDFEVPQNGAVKGAGVNWLHVDGFMVEPENRGSRFQIGGMGHNFLETFTDDAGKARIFFRGVQRRNEVPDIAKQVDKEFKVRVNIRAQPPKIRSVFAGATAGLVEMIPEMILAGRWLSSPTYTFPVTDWETNGYRFSLSCTMAREKDFTWTVHAFGKVCGDPLTMGWDVSQSHEIFANAPGGHQVIPLPDHKRPLYAVGSPQALREEALYQSTGGWVYYFIPGEPAQVKGVFIPPPTVSDRSRKIVTVTAEDNPDCRK